MKYPWLMPLWLQLSNQYRQQTLPHALMINGIEGLGHEALATALAQFILCKHPTDTHCHSCRSCELFDAGTHPDYLVVCPQEGSALIDIEQIRNMTEKTNQTPLISASQVVLIQSADRLNIKAANALLKTLEEPPGQVFFIFICYSLSLVPVTILSRCQQFSVKAVDLPDVTAWLSSHVPLQECNLLLNLSYGAPLKALEFSGKNIIALRNRVLETLAYPVSQINPVLAIEQLSKEADDVFILLESFFQDILKCYLNVDTTRFIHADQRSYLQELSQLIHKEQLQMQMDALLKIKQAFKKGVAINKQLALERLILGVYHGS